MSAALQLGSVSKHHSASPPRAGQRESRSGSGLTRDPSFTAGGHSHPCAEPAPGSGPGLSATSAQGDKDGKSRVYPYIVLHYIISYHILLDYRRRILKKKAN